MRVEAVGGDIACARWRAPAQKKSDRTNREIPSRPSIERSPTRRLACCLVALFALTVVPVLAEDQVGTLTVLRHVRPSELAATPFIRAVDPLAIFST